MISLKNFFSVNQQEQEQPPPKSSAGINWDAIQNAVKIVKTAPLPVPPPPQQASSSSSQPLEMEDGEWKNDKGTVLRYHNIETRLGIL